MVERRNTSMPSKPLKPHELDKIATATLAHYEQHAEEFRAGTLDHDVSQNIASLLRHIEGESPFTILDFGCGPRSSQQNERRVRQRRTPCRCEL
jgi:predicted TPR repeat methyltransferase